MTKLETILQFAKILGGIIGIILLYFIMRELSYQSYCRPIQERYYNKEIKMKWQGCQFYNNGNWRAVEEIK